MFQRMCIFDQDKFLTKWKLQYIKKCWNWDSFKCSGRPWPFQNGLERSSQTNPVTLVSWSIWYQLNSFRWEFSEVWAYEQTDWQMDSTINCIITQKNFFGENITTQAIWIFSADTSCITMTDLCTLRLATQLVFSLPVGGASDPSPIAT
jgi:hypothetical protein